MFIVPITPIMNFNQIDQIGKITSIDQASSGGLQGGVNVPFSDFFKQAMDNVNQTQATVEQDERDVMVGNIDNLAQVAINLEKATIALDVLIQTRTKALDAYGEIIRMNV